MSTTIDLPAFQPADYNSDLKPVWCAGCGDFGWLCMRHEQDGNCLRIARGCRACAAHQRAVNFVAGTIRFGPLDKGQSLQLIEPGGAEPRHERVVGDMPKQLNARGGELRPILAGQRAGELNEE